MYLPPEARGWQVTTRRRQDLFADCGLTFPDDDEMAAFRNIVAVTAIRQ
ncbi:hypothetical protein [Mycobacterium sp.]|nr:hypothetical protein [Mycobacterium sp.]